MANYDAIATRVMRGDFGNGQDRKNRLRAAGYSNSEIDAIQQRVNQMFYGAPVPAAPVPAAPAPAAQTPVVSKPAPTPPTLSLPDPPKYAGVKSAPIDTIEFIDETFSDNLIIDLLFEDVGGQELLTIARNDTVNGQSVVYQPFKNLGILQETYNATTLLRLQQTSDKFFSNFLINLRDRIPVVGSGENGKNYYLHPTDGSGIIEFINIRPDEQVEIQIASAGIIEETGI